MVVQSKTRRALAMIVLTMTIFISCAEVAIVVPARSSTLTVTLA